MDDDFDFKSMLGMLSDPYTESGATTESHLPAAASFGGNPTRTGSPRVSGLSSLCISIYLMLITNIT